MPAPCEWSAVPHRDAVTCCCLSKVNTALASSVASGITQGQVLIWILLPGVSGWLFSPLRDTAHHPAKGPTVSGIEVSETSMRRKTAEQGWNYSEGPQRTGYGKKVAFGIRGT